MTTPKKKPTHTPPPPTAHPAADLIIDQLIDQQIAKDEKRSHSPLSGGNEKGGKGRGEGGEGILHALAKLTGKPPLAYHVRPNGDVSVITWEGKKFLFTKQEIDSV